MISDSREVENSVGQQETPVHAHSLSSFVREKPKLKGFFIGQVMKLKGQADPQAVGKAGRHFVTSLSKRRRQEDSRCLSDGYDICVAQRYFYRKLTLHVGILTLRVQSSPSDLDPPGSAFPRSVALRFEWQL